MRRLTLLPLELDNIENEQHANLDELYEAIGTWGRFDIKCEI